MNLKLSDKQIYRISQYVGIPGVEDSSFTGDSLGDAITILENVERDLYNEKDIQAQVSLVLELLTHIPR